MTQAEIETIAKDLRTKCMRSSWNDLVAFWEDVMSNLETAYHALDHRANMQHTSTEDVTDERVAREKLGLALSQLAGDRMTARFDQRL